MRIRIITCYVNKKENVVQSSFFFLESLYLKTKFGLYFIYRGLQTDFYRNFKNSVEVEDTSLHPLFIWLVIYSRSRQRLEG